MKQGGCGIVVVVLSMGNVVVMFYVKESIRCCEGCCVIWRVN